MLKTEFSEIPICLGRNVDSIPMPVSAAEYVNHLLRRLSGLKDAISYSGQN
jgi:hypothetical protein